MTATDPYAELRADLSGMPPVPGLDQMGATIHEPTAAQRLREHPQQPEAVVYVPGPGGAMVPVLAQHYQPPTTTPPQPDQHTPVNTAPDVWPKRLMAAGGSVAAVIGSIAMAGPHLTEAGHAVQMGGIGVAATAGGVGLLFALVKGSLGSSKQAPVNLAVHVTNTSTSRSASSSRSNHRNR